MATCLACLVVLWGHFIICVCTLAAQAKLKQNGCSSHEGWSGSDRVEIEVPHQTINSTTYKSNYTTRLTTTNGQPWPVAHSGMYLKLSRGEGIPSQVAFHKQLFQDHHGPVPGDCVSATRTTQQQTTHSTTCSNSQEQHTTAYTRGAPPRG